MNQQKELPSKIEALKQLAQSDDWSEREEAGFALRNLAEESFEDVMRLTQSWLTHPSDRVRRAACLACMQRKARTSPVRVRRILHRLETLMKDDSLYVRKCCGPFVVGYLGYTYPSITLPWLRKQANKHDLNIRSNVAKAFSQALGGNYPKEGLSILHALSGDERIRVRSAVIAALRNILRRGAATSDEIKEQFPHLYNKVAR